MLDFYNIIVSKLDVRFVIHLMMITAPPVASTIPLSY